MSSKARSKQSGGAETNTRPPNTADQQTVNLPHTTQFYLPDGYVVVYAVFKSTFQDAEYARHTLAKRNSNRKLFECYLPYPQITKNEARLWVFVLCNDRDAADKQEENLKAMHLSGLEFMLATSFTYQDVYNCSSSCSHSRDSSVAIASDGDTPETEGSNKSNINVDKHDYSTATSSPVFQMATPFSSEMLSTLSCCVPRDIRRTSYTYLLLALKEHFIESLCRCNTATLSTKFYDGVLFSALSRSQIWCSTWNQPSQMCLIHCKLSLRLCPTSLNIVPHFYPTQLSPLILSVAYPVGAPLVLFPYGTPAHFVSRYTGPVAQLSKQFEDILGPHDNDTTAPAKLGADSDATSFINVWVVVRTPEGAERGLNIIWPSKLCASIRQRSNSSYEYGRQRLLTLDRRLAPQVPVSSPLDSLFSPSEPPSTATRTLFPSIGEVVADNQREEFKLRSAVSIAEQTRHRALGDIFATVANDSSRNRDDVDFHKVAISVGSYVDSVAKERERERERLRRERDASSSQSPKLYNSSIPSNGAAMNMSIDQHSMDDMQPYDLSPGPAIPTSPPVLSGLTDHFSMFHVNNTSIHTPQQVAVEHDNHHPYPSPPDEGGSLFGRSIMQSFSTSGLHPPNTTDYMLTPAPSSGIAYQSITNMQPSQTFDSTEFASAWANASSFMMDLDNEMGTKLPSSTVSDKGNEANQAADAFSSLFSDDDDPFSFFDQPPAQPRVNAQSLDPLDAQAIAQAVADHLDPTRIAALMGETAAHDSPVQGLTPWLEQMAQYSPDVHIRNRSVDVAAPELSTSPTSPLDHYTLVTPSGDEATSPQLVHVEDSKEEFMFNAIAFASKHRVANEKYTSGKFMTQSPSVVATVRSESGDIASWSSIYAKITDPSQRVIEKLTEVKRRSAAVPLSNLTSVFDECFQAMEVDADDQDSIEEIWSDDDETKVSRPSSPEAPMFCIGVLLLASRFNYSLLLQLSTGITGTETSLNTPAFASPVTNIAPTPISPGFITNSPDDDGPRWHDSEIRLLAQEVMLNPLWAFALMSQGSQGQEALQAQISQSSHIVQSIAAGFGQHPSDTSLSSNSQVGNSHPLSEELQQPQITVSKCNGLINVNLSALRFWEKLGLGPRSGTKDIVAFLLHEDDRYVRNAGPAWMRFISEHYRRKGYGTHRCGDDELSANAGLVSFQLDQLQAIISAILLKRTTSAPAIVIYIVVPPSDLPRSARHLKLLRTLARISQTHSRNNITFHLVARSEFSSSIEDDLSFRKWAIDVTVDSVYNRVLRRVPLAGTSRLHPTEPNVAFFQAPVFTIARQSQKHVSFTYQYPPPDAGALDESTILHVGYRVSQCRRYVFASVVDERGEEQDVSAWFISCDREAFWQQVVANVWTFALRAASRARVQWTMVMAKLGGIEELELDAWLKQFSASLSDAGHLTKATLVAVECDQSPGPETQRRANGKNVWASPRSRAFIDSLPTMRAQLVSPIFRPQIPPCRDEELFARTAVVDDEHAPLDGMELLKPLISSALQFIDQRMDGTTNCVLYIHLFHTVKTSRSTCTKSLSELQAYICQNFYELALLAHTRSFVHKSSSLPIHLAVLQTIHSSLRIDELTPV